MLKLPLRLEYQRKYQEALRHNETEAESVECLQYKRKYQEALRQSETENERMVRLKSRTLLYETSKTLQSKGYLNFARSQISAEVSDGLVEQHSISSMSYSCPICDAKFWESEKLSTSTKACAKFSLCCGEGKVVLPSIDIHPELLGHLLTVIDSRGKDFRNHIRAYNSILAFCSLGANIDKELANARLGVYVAVHMHMLQCICCSAYAYMLQCIRGLLDDSEYDLCLTMAASWHMPPQLRHLFVTFRTM